MTSGNIDQAAPAESLAGLSIILISPNVSEQMGGEAIKALQIYQELARRGAIVHQITHERVKRELERNYPHMVVSYVRDSWLQITAWRLGKINPRLSQPAGLIIALAFQWRAARLAELLLREHPGSIVHFTSPISTVLPYFTVSGGPVIIGPLNANIHYPEPFRGREDLSHFLRRKLHVISQLASRIGFSGKRRAEILLVAREIAHAGHCYWPAHPKTA